MFNTKPNLVSLTHVVKLAKNRGWVITLAVFLFIFGTILILGAMGNMINGSGALTALINLFIGGAYIIAGIKFCSYCGKINLSAQNQSSELLESAIQAQAKAWMWLGICSIIYSFVAIFALLAGLLATL